MSVNYILSKKGKNCSQSKNCWRIPLLFAKEALKRD